MVYVRTLIALLLLLPFAKAYSADWQYTGGTKDGSSFFDAEGVQYPEKDTVRVWVKSITNKTGRNCFKGKKGKKLIEDSAQKMASGYIPSYLLLESIKRIYKSKDDYENGRNSRSDWRRDYNQ
jgi:hypothetical protein